MTNKEVRSLLLEHSEDKYKKFSLSLLPNVKKERFLGVRIPYLRTLAKEISKEKPLEFLSDFPEEYFEDIMLKGFVTGFGSFTYEDRLELIKNHVDKIDNWSLCDSFASSLKFIKKNKQDFLKFLEPYFESEEEFKARFSLVCLLHYYNDSQRSEENLNIISDIKSEAYYALMAKAWAIAEICTVDPKSVYTFLKSGRTDDFTHNKAIDKIRDSLKVPKDHKERVSALKR